MEIPDYVYELIKQKDRERFKNAVNEIGLPITESVEKSLYLSDQIIREAGITYLTAENLYDTWNNGIKKIMREHSIKSAVAAILSNSGGATGTKSEKELAEKKVREYLK